jgi:hypothetical protein
VAPHSSPLAWKIPWTEEPVHCSPWGCEESDMTERLHFHFSHSCIGEGNGNPLQCSCLENPRDRGAWWAAIYGVAQSQTRLKRLSSSNSPVILRYSIFNLGMSPVFLSVQLLVSGFLCFFFFLPLNIIITCLNSLSQNVTPSFGDSFELLYVALSRSFIAICQFFIIITLKFLTSNFCVFLCLILCLLIFASSIKIVQKKKEVLVCLTMPP